MTAEDAELAQQVIDEFPRDADSTAYARRVLATYHALAASKQEVARLRAALGEKIAECEQLRAAVAALGTCSLGTIGRVMFTIERQEIVCDFRAFSHEHPADALLRHTGVRRTAGAPEIPPEQARGCATKVPEGRP